MRHARPAIFLDRDDTLIDTRGVTAGTAHPGDLFDPALVRLLPGVLEGCRGLKAAGFLLVIVSNQGAIAAGLATISDVEATNERVRALVCDPTGKTVIDAVYYSPARPSATGPVAEHYNRDLSWRKPAPGMILAAQRDLNIDMSKSWIVGDSARDVQAGIAAGLAPERCLLVGSSALRAAFTSLGDAAAHILRLTYPMPA